MPSSIASFLCVAMAASSVAVQTAAESTTALPDCGATAYSALATNPNVAQCMIQSEIPIFALTEPPTPAQLAVFCKTAPCRELLKLFATLEPVECVLPFDGHSILRSDIINISVHECASVGNPVQLNTTTVDSNASATTNHQSNVVSRASLDGRRKQTLGVSMALAALVSIALAVV